MSISRWRSSPPPWYVVFSALPTMSGLVPTERCTTQAPSVMAGMSLKRGARYASSPCQNLPSTLSRAGAPAIAK